MNILFTVCGRAGSKGVKGKNMRDMCGVPLVLFPLAAISLYIERYGKDDRFEIVLNTDSELLFELAKKAPVEVTPLPRRESLAGDNAPKVSVICDCLDFTEERLGEEFQMVVDLDITSPLRRVEDIKKAIEKKKQNQKADVVFSVTHARRNPYFNMVTEQNGEFVKVAKSHYVTRQEAPVLYDMNGSIYAYSPFALKNKDPKVFFNDKADVVLMRDTGFLDIDSEEDYKMMAVIAKHLFETEPEYAEIYERALSWIK